MTAAVALPVVNVRPPTAGELKFIRETCLKVRQPRTGVTWRSWEAWHGAAVDAYLSQSDVSVADLDGLVVGFLAADDAVRMLYVKADFRGYGIGLTLLNAARVPSPIKAWHPTQSWHRWCERRGLLTETVR